MDSTSPVGRDNGFEDDAIHCDICNMWLNGPTQWEDHKLGRKHRRNDAIARMQRDAAESPDACAATPGQAPDACAAEQEDPPGCIRISLLALSGNIIGTVLTRSKATWPEVAVAIRRANPTMQPVPPSRARHLIAADLEVEGVQVMFRPEPYACDA